MIATLAALPTGGGAGEAPAAQLQVAEVFPDPSGNMTEAEAEWTEIEVIAGGELAGWALTDFDGAVDFTFPAAAAVAGERLLVANGHTVPSGAPAGARVFFANKSWWTFDNAGDEAALLTPGGAVGDAISWGSGEAVDEMGSAAAAPGEVLAGASVGRSDGGVGWLRPTPGMANIALARAGEGRVTVAAVLGSAQTMAAALCVDAGQPFDPYLWTVAWGPHAVPLGEEPMAAGECLLAGAPVELALAQVAGASLGAPFSGSTVFSTASWNSSTAVDLLDPWGTVALSFHPPAEDGPVRRVPVLWTPCQCPGGWTGAAARPLSDALLLRPVEDLRIVRAGPELERAALALISGANTSIVLNAYLLTAASIQGALANASARGISVRLLLEAAPVGGVSQTNALSPESTEAWNTSGVWARAFGTAPPNPARDHAKYAIADGRSFLVATENFVGAALSADDPNTGYALVGNSTPLAGDLAALFEWDFALGADRTAPGRSIPDPAPKSLEVAGVGTASAALVVSPDVGVSNWVGLVDNATARVDFEVLSADLATAGPGAPLGRALLSACARGAAVHGLLAGSYEGTEGNENLAVARALMAAAAEASCVGRMDLRIDGRPETSRSVLHAKVLVVDGTRAIMGSHNWVKAAFASNREVSLSIESLEAAGSLEAMLALDFAGADPVEAAPLALGGDGQVGSPERLEVHGGGAPTYPTLAFVGAASMVMGLSRLSRRRRRARAAPFKSGPENAISPLDRPPPAFDPITRAAREESGPDEPPQRESFNPRADPPATSQRKDAGHAALPANAFELFEKG
jgi:phosphatidylserine/phosphatidylglycerophosphate/cardiolipin synthase-like enzyme